MLKNNNKSGFTIIEVVLVLAIAGLIFLMVFIALPALQRSQRDAQRKNDLVKIKDAIDRYKTNNKGKLPFLERDVGIINYRWSNDQRGKNFLSNYVDENNQYLLDPSGSEYVFYYIGATLGADGRFPGQAGNWRQSNMKDRTIYIARARKCAVVTQTANGYLFDPAAAYNNYALAIKMESGGSYCLSN